MSSASKNPLSVSQKVRTNSVTESESSDVSNVDSFLADVEGLNLNGSLTTVTSLNLNKPLTLEYKQDDISHYFDPYENLFETPESSPVSSRSSDSGSDVGSLFSVDSTESTFHPFDRPASVATVVQVSDTMAPASKTVHLNNYRSDLLLWEDEYSAVEVKSLSSTCLTELIRELREMLGRLRDARIYFQSNPCAEFGEEDVEQLDELRSKAGKMVQEAKSRSGAPSEASAIAAKTIAAIKPSIMSTFHQLKADYAEVKKLLPTNTAGYKALEAQHQAVEKDAEDTLKQLEGLRQEAISAKCESTAGLAVDTMAELRDVKRTATQHLKATRDRLGILPGQGAMATPTINMKAPKFSGKFDGLDYFTFEKKLNEFFDYSGAYSDSLKLLKLKNDCTVEPASKAITNCDEFDVAMAKLKKLYGQPKLLFNVKEDDLRKLGKCPDSCLERRNWLIEMKNRLSDLWDLAETHKIEHKFESGEVLGIIEAGLRPRDAERFLERLYKVSEEDDNFYDDEGASKAKELIVYLNLLIDSCTFELNHKLNVTNKSSKEILQSVKSFNDKNSDNRQKDSTRKSYTNKVASKPHSDDPSDSDSPADAGGGPPTQAMSYSSENKHAPKVTLCKHCNKKHTTLVYCQKYQDTLVKDRFRSCSSIRACPRCLRLDASFDIGERQKWFESHKINCNDRNVCKVDKCAERPAYYQNHFTMCARHMKQNKKLETEFIESLNKKFLPANTKFFFTHVRPQSPIPPTQQTCTQQTENAKTRDATQKRPENCGEGGKSGAYFAFKKLPFDDKTIIEPDEENDPIYMLQYIPGPKNEKLLCFYDTGCFGAAISERGYAVLPSTCVRPGPTVMDVAGNQQLILPDGDEQIFVELDREDSLKHVAKVTALRMQNISSRFPLWPLTEAYDDLKNGYAAAGEDIENFPTVEEKIGNRDVDVMLGMKYNKYFPQALFYLPSGLCMYKAVLKGFNGHQGVLGGPHEVWTRVLEKAYAMGPAVFLTMEMRAFRAQSRAIFTDLGTLCQESSIPPPYKVPVYSDEDEANNDITRILHTAAVTTKMKEMQHVDEIGADIEYRCGDCRTCTRCKNAEAIEKVSLQEEREQFLIEKSVEYVETEKALRATLPFIQDPETHLVNNFFVAKKVLESQVKLAQKNPDTIPQIIASHEKLRSKGYVVKLEDLPKEERKLAEMDGYYLPWRTVHSGSLSTPCRMVYDASARCKSGYSLNCILAKGTNMIATLLHLLLKFRIGVAAFSADVSMAYNQIKLDPKHYRYQKYLWAEELDPKSEIITMVVNTLIYGVKSSGNLTMIGFQLTAAAAKQVPELKDTGGPECLEDDSYVDDVFSAFMSTLRRDTASDGLEGTLALSQMQVKAITKSGFPPTERVSADGVNVSMVGYLWEPLEDMLKLDIKPLYLGKAKRGKLPELVTGPIREALAEQFTRRILAGKVAGVFDPLGLAAPVTARLKVDLSEIVRVTDGWDDKINDSYLDRWVENLADIQQLSELRVPRSIFSKYPTAEHSIQLIVATDASQLLAAAAVYTRVKIADDKFGCMLAAAKTKLISKMTIPKAELRACTMGACLAEIVKKNCKGLVSDVMYVTDSTVALSWMKTDTRPLQVGVRNMVIQIRRFSSIDDWYHVPSAENPADIPTRGAEVKDILAGSDWMDGKKWMSGRKEDMPVCKVDDLVLTPAEKTDFKGEVRNSDVQGIVLMNQEAVAERYSLSRYVVDPCSKPWPKFVRQIAVLMKIVKCFRTEHKLPRFKGKPLMLVDPEDFDKAREYIFKLTTQETQHFNKPKDLQDGAMRNGILRHTGRILDGVTPSNPMKILLDLEPLTFAAPMVDRNSPVAYSIMIHSHVTLTHHGGVVSTLRASRNLAYILHGKNLAKEVREDCAYCQRYKVKAIEAVMGKVHPSRMTIAPAFYCTQVDIFGPLPAHCFHGRRSVLKAYGVVFKCSTTLAVAANIMETYETKSFVDAFVRFSCRYGVPGTLYIDAGSQLMAACRNAEMSIADISHTINVEHGTKIDHQVCPVGDHEENGAVERQIREIRRILHAVFKGLKMDFVRLETCLAWICNEINNMPLCIGNQYTDLEHLDLITPSRLLLGRNNTRALADLPTADNFSELVKQNADFEKAWWTVWEAEKLIDMIPQPSKWRSGDPDIKVGDLVVFMRDKSVLTGPSWRVGEVSSVEVSRDEIIRKVEVKYKVVGESVYRYTRRSVRSVAVLWRESEIDLTGKLSAAQRQANMLCLRSLSAFG